MESLEKKFHEDMKQIYFCAKRDLQYNATRFLQLVIEKGFVKAAKQIIEKDTVTYGFEVLWKSKRLDLSVEAYVIKPEYRELFTNEEIELCCKRLKEANYDC